MIITNGNDLAFARPAFYHFEGGVSHPQDGCTKREYFAAMAMQGLLANNNNNNNNIQIERLSKQAVYASDALLYDLNVTK